MPLKTVKLSEIKSTFNPVRKTRDSHKMKELVESIKEQGIIVPPKLRPNGNGYEIVYGNRRIEAARRAGLTEIECIVDDTPSEIMTTVGLTENFVRENMSAVEIAEAFQKQVDQGETMTAVGAKYGLTRQAVKNYLNLIDGAIGEVTKRFSPAERANIPARLARRVMASTETEKDAARVFEYAVKQRITSDQAYKVGQSITAAPDEKTKKELLDTPYSSLIHDPGLVRVEATESRIKKKVREAFAEEVRDFLKLLSHLDAMATESLEAGKFSPEAKQFAIHRLEHMRWRFDADTTPTEESTKN